jgi:aromatic ring-cleaving dioxygenase
MGNAPYHAHIYFENDQRVTAAHLREQFQAMPEILFVGQMTEGPAGPHPIPQYEVHFLASALDKVVELIKISPLTALVHPLTEDDLADHTSLGHWIGAPIKLDLSVLDPPGHNKGIPRFGISDF